MSFYIFNPEYPEPFSLIHPLKLEQVKALVSDALPPYISCVILFGSSLDLTCTPFGDVDLYVITDDGKSAYKYFYEKCKKLNMKADILVADAQTFMEEALDINAIERQVLKQGVVVYEDVIRTAETRIPKINEAHNKTVADHFKRILSE
jgi:predicted nucleotidyltransferase